MPKLRKIFNECGVAFVLLPQLKNSGINGVVKWINPKKVLLALNDRRHYADIFWFALFHEIMHIFQENTKDASISFDKNFSNLHQKQEDEADKFARDTLVPPDKYRLFLSLNSLNAASIRQFADDIKNNVGIVIGRLQNDKYIPNNSVLNKLKDKYKIA